MRGFFIHIKHKKDHICPWYETMPFTTMEILEWCFGHFVHISISEIHHRKANKVTYRTFTISNFEDRMNFDIPFPAVDKIHTGFDQQGQLIMEYEPLKDYAIRAQQSILNIVRSTFIQIEEFTSKAEREG